MVVIDEGRECERDDGQEGVERIAILENGESLLGVQVMGPVARHDGSPDSVTSIVESS